MKNYLFLLSIFLFIPRTNMSQQKTWKSDYHKYSKAQFEFGKKIVSFLKVKHANNILDVGCGTGRTTSLFAAKEKPEANIIGIDFSADMIDFAKNEFKEIKNLSFEVSSATDLKYVEQFDLVYSIFCLHWLKNAQKIKAVEKIFNSLKPKGFAYLYVSCRNDMFYIWDDCMDEIAKENPSWKPFIFNNVHIEPVNFWEKLARESGFKVVKSDLFEREFIFETQNDFKNHVRGLKLTRLEDGENEKFIDVVTNKMYAKFNKTKDDSFVFKPATLFLELEK